MNNFNWLPQNDFQFEPRLFNEYREPQDNVFSNIDFDESFFKDAFDMDFPTPYNLPVTYPTTTTQPPKKDLMAEIEAAKNADALDSNGQLLTCTKIWYVLSMYPRLLTPDSVANTVNRETLQNCPKVQSGDFDLDGLCSDLQKKAKCSGQGAVVGEMDFNDVIKKYLGKSGDCSTSKLKADATK